MKLFRRKSQREKDIDKITKLTHMKLNSFSAKFNIPYDHIQNRYLDQLETLRLSKGIHYTHIEKSALVRVLAWLREMEEYSPPIRPPPLTELSNYTSPEALGYKDITMTTTLLSEVEWEIDKECSVCSDGQPEPDDVFCAYCGSILKPVKQRKLTTEPGELRGYP